MQGVDFKLRLGIEVRDGGVFIRDLYDLMDWSLECSEQQCLRLANGWYLVTVYSSLPASGITG